MKTKLWLRTLSLLLCLMLCVQCCTFVAAAETEPETSVPEETAPVVEGELTEKRTANEKYFMRSDQSILAAVYPSAVHYQDTDGNWQEIDNRLQESETDGVTDIVICGMGGELIARIADASAYTRNPDVRLILQPMTCAPELRQYLWDNGFRILEERLCGAAGKIYTCMHVLYDGEVRTYTPAELILGKSNIEKREPLFEEYAKNTIRRLKTQIDGMKKGGLDTAKEEADLASVETAVSGGTK